MTGMIARGAARGGVGRRVAGLLAGGLLWAGVVVAADAGSPGSLPAAMPPGSLPQSQVDGHAAPLPAVVPPRNSGPAARSHSRYRRGRRATTRVIRRTPEVMREDAARVRRGDLFSTWSNQYLE